MSKYIIFRNNGGLACKKIVAEEIVRYIETEDEFKKLIHSFIRSGYKVRIKNGDMALIGRNDSIVLKSCYEIINDRMLKELAIDIERTVNQNGYVDVTKKNQLNKEVNREKSNSGLPMVVKVGLGLVVVAGILFAIHNSISKNNNQYELQGVEPTIPPSRNEEQQEPSQSQGIKPDCSSEFIAYKTSMGYVETLDNQSNELEMTELNNNETSTEIEVLSQQPYETITQEPETMDYVTSNSYVEQEPSLPREDVPTAYLNFENNSRTDKAQTAKELYMPYFEDCAYRFGLDANLLLCIGTQERGVHSDVVDTLGGIGLMQVQYDVWINKTVDYMERNPSTGEFEKKTITITDAMLRDVKSNIEVASIILQTYMKISKYNIPVAIQMYNMGDGALKSILRTYGATCGKTLDELFETPEDLGWTEYRYLKQGDKQYLEKVNQWAEDPIYSVLNLNTMEEVTFGFTNEETMNHII